MPLTRTRAVLRSHRVGYLLGVRWQVAGVSTPQLAVHATSPGGRGRRSEPAGCLGGRGALIEQVWPLSSPRPGTLLLGGSGGGGGGATFPSCSSMLED